MEWVPEIDYRGYKLTLLVLEVNIETVKSGKEEKKAFQWLTDLRGTGKNTKEFAQAGRSRWRTENEGFNMQKTIRYDIEYANSLDYNGMKCHYLLHLYSSYPENKKIYCSEANKISSYAETNDMLLLPSYPFGCTTGQKITFLQPVHE